MSTHTAKVISLPFIKKHPNADSLGCVDLGGYQVVVALKDWKEGDLCVYIEPDTILPDRPEHAWLGGHLRIKVKKLRGMFSQGLLLPAPEGLQLGDEAWDALGLTRYEPPEPGVSGASSDLIKTPVQLTAPKYDLENLRRYPTVIMPGEYVEIREKIHGTNSKFAFLDGQMYAGRRTGFVKFEPGNWYVDVLKYEPWIEEWCRRHEGTILFGEIYGVQKGFKYDTTEQAPLKFRAFDIFKNGMFYPLFDLPEERCAPLLYSGPFELQAALALAEGQTTIPGATHVREGCVVSVGECMEPRRMAAVKLKVVGNSYFENKDS